MKPQCPQAIYMPFYDLIILYALGDRLMGKATLEAARAYALTYNYDPVICYRNVLLEVYKLRLLLRPPPRVRHPL